MEGQRIASNLRVCSRCHIIKSTADFYRCGAISKKTGLRYLSSLCKPCHQQATHSGTRRRRAEEKEKTDKEKKDRHKGQQIVLRDAFISQAPLPIPELAIAEDQHDDQLVDQVFEASYDSDFALPEAGLGHEYANN